MTLPRLVSNPTIEGRSILEEDIILSCLCDEPDGQIERHVRFMPMSLSNLRKFWNKSRQFPTLFGQEVASDFKKFLELLVEEGPNGIAVRGMFWVVDDFVGIYYLTDIQELEDAKVHYSFFDRRQKGRIELSRAMLRYVMDRYQFPRLSVEVPMFVSKMTIKFINEVGFQKEGRKRRAAYYRGDRFDVCCYGILREELDNGR